MGRRRKVTKTKEQMYRELSTSERGTGRPSRLFSDYVALGVSDERWQGILLHIINRYLNKHMDESYERIAISLRIPFNAVQQIPRGRSIGYKKTDFFRVVNVRAKKVLDWMYETGRSPYNHRQLVLSILAAKNELRAMMTELEMFVPAQVAENIESVIQNNLQISVDSSEQVVDNDCVD